MIDKDSLLSALYAKHKNLSDLANFLNVTNSSLSRKLKGGTFTRKEIDAIKKELGLEDSQVVAIFFGQ